MITIMENFELNGFSVSADALILLIDIKTTPNKATTEAEINWVLFFKTSPYFSKFNNIIYL